MSVLVIVFAIVFAIVCVFAPGLIIATRTRVVYSMCGSAGLRVLYFRRACGPGAFGCSLFRPFHNPWLWLKLRSRVRKRFVMVAELTA